MFNRSEITDRYDHSFIFGDLNFRIDLSRQEAESLIHAKGTYPKRLLAIISRLYVAFFRIL